MILSFATDLRFPGQWFQAEFGLHQNWMRDYDPTTGRYMQADPLGLVDGASVYGYARQNPGRYFDFYGLESGVANPGNFDIGIGGIKIGGRLVGGVIAGILYPSTLGNGEVIPWINGVPDTFSERDCGDDCSPATAPFWNSLQNVRGKIYRMSGRGRSRLYYKWDYGHFCEVEVFDRLGRHLGAVDGRTGTPIKRPEPGRREPDVRQKFFSLL